MPIFVNLIMFFEVSRAFWNSLHVCPTYCRSVFVWRKLIHFVWNSLKMHQPYIFLYFSCQFTVGLSKGGEYSPQAHYQAAWLFTACPSSDFIVAITVHWVIRFLGKIRRAYQWTLLHRDTSHLGLHFPPSRMAAWLVCELQVCVPLKKYVAFVRFY